MSPGGGMASGRAFGVAAAGGTAGLATLGRLGGVVALLLAAGAGCQIRSVGFTGDGGGVGGSGASGGINGDGQMGGAGGGGTGGAGGGVGGGAGDARTDACVSVPEQCNGLDDDCDGVIDNGFDLTGDAANCGACGNICSFEHSFSLCDQGVCRVDTCLPGFVDVDKMDANGCECLITNGGKEICDDADNDCDGIVDNGFDKLSDPMHCGSCSTACAYAHGAALCDMGACKMGSCDAGYLDVNKDDKDGCEYKCTPSNGGVEICDGVDNDCNGKIDDAPIDEGAPCGLPTSATGECKAGKMTCTSGTLFCIGAVGPMIEVCDGKDNDCNGKTDEGFDKLNDVRWCGGCTPCSLDHAAPKCVMGVCQIDECSPGYVNLDGKQDNGCEYACVFRGPDVCNGLDDDCNGVTDDGIDVTTDVNNCGKCGHVCSFANASASCVGGACKMGACKPNFTDKNGMSADGCESFCVSTGAEICDGIDNNCNGAVDEGFNLATDVNNCGACGRKCQYLNASAKCEAGVCKLDACAAGFHDADGNPDTGCEYGCTPSNGGVEICDGLDNNCDGAVDESDPAAGTACYPMGVVGCDVGAMTCHGPCGFGAWMCLGNTLLCVGAKTPGVELCDDVDNDCDGVTDNGFDKHGSDPRFCGGCNTPCALPNAVNGCSGGTCTIVVCKPGYVDFDKDPSNGCEYACTPDGPEVCDGKDNDCDKLTDEADPDLLYPTTNFCVQTGECGNLPTHAATRWGSTGTYSYPVCRKWDMASAPDWICNYDDNANVQVTGPNLLITQETLCDTMDNDCDGLTDEAFDKGATCYDTGIGACRRTGSKQCTMDKTGTTCTYSGPAPSPSAEKCNGIDDDCNNAVDDLVGGNGYDDTLVSVNGITIFAFEASRPDASGSAQGSQTGPRPCSLPDKLPWTDVTKEEAAAACAALGTGWRLCSSSEYQNACNGASNTTFPYGNSYTAGTCNGYDYGVHAPVKTKQASSCVASGIYDMSGNVREWVTTGTGTGYAAAGGAYDTLSFSIGGSTTAPGLQCSASIAAPTTTVRLPSIGFRCCKTGTFP